MLFFFFFQAEDGIRDFHVTGVQTCALPISPGGSRPCTTACVRRRATWPTRSVSARAGSPTGGDIVRMRRSVHYLIVDCRQFSLATAFALQQVAHNKTGEA